MDGCSGTALGVTFFVSFGFILPVGFFPAGLLVAGFLAAGFLAPGFLAPGFLAAGFRAFISLLLAG